jgi:hypothetical protein
MNDINVKEGSYQQIGQLIQQLQKIRSFTGHPVRFWPAFLELATRLSRGRAGMLVARVMDGGSWQRLHVWPAKESNLIQAPATAVHGIVKERMYITALTCWSSGFASNWMSRNGYMLLFLFLMKCMQREWNKPRCI